MSGVGEDGRSLHWTDWARGALAVVVGYALYAMGLMGLVMFWFIRGDGIGNALAHAGNVVALGLLGLVLAETVVRISGRGARVAVLIVVGLIGAVSALNLYLGVSIEPRWFTVLSFLLISSSLIGRRAAVTGHESSG